MTGQIQSSLTLMPGDALYEGLRQEFASPEFIGQVKGFLFRHIHPLANLLPMIPEPQRPSFRASLAEVQNQPVILHQGKLLDGRNRSRELIELQKPISAKVFVGTTLDALKYVKAENIERRHLNESQRADFAARVAALPVGANQHTTKPAQICAPGLPLDGLSPTAVEETPKPLLSQGEAASEFNVSRRLVQAATKYQKDGIPELAAAVQAGEMRASVAAEIAALPVEQQREIIAAANPKVVKDVAKKNRSDKQIAGRERRLANMAKPDAVPLLSGGGKVGVFYIDIPRKFVQWSDDSGAEKSPENHYRVETFEYLAGLRDMIQARAKDNCAVFMWAWANSLQDQLDLLAEWGFASVRRRDEAGRLSRGDDGKILKPVGEGRYRSHQIWAKRASTGNLNRGTGFWFIDCHELLLVGARGDVPAPIMGTQAMSILDLPVGDHSAKPADFRKQIDHYFPGVPKLEMFGRVDDPAAFRQEYPDWDVWGNEASASPSGDVATATGAAPSPPSARAEAAE